MLGRPLFFCYLLTIFPILPYLGSIGLYNQTISWIMNSVLVISAILVCKKYFKPSNKADYYTIYVFGLWSIIGIIRGIFVADNYWEYKALISSSFDISVPIFAIIFSFPAILSRSLHYWIKFSIPLFCIIGIWMVSSLRYQFLLGPIYLLICFFPFASKKWKILLLGFALFLLFTNFGARSQSLKSLVSILIALAFIFHRIIGKKIIYITFWSLWIIPIILLTLGITGKFNMFEDLSSHQGEYIETKTGEDLSSDTRTFIYKETILSAVHNKYVLYGRTPARGNDSKAFGAFNAEVLRTGKYERFKNEVCHLNIFTWLGIIGSILYSSIYFVSSYRAVFNSRNKYIQFIGLLISFHWAYGWIEDINNFDILTISLWMMIAMGLSYEYRQMSNKAFKLWARNIFIKTL